jgi:hypothetical protein
MDQSHTVANTRVDVDGNLAGALGVSCAIPLDSVPYEILVDARLYAGDDQGWGSSDVVGFWMVENSGGPDSDVANVGSASNMHTSSTALWSAAEPTLHYRNASPSNGTTYQYRIQFAIQTPNNTYINPTAGNGFRYNAGHFSTIQNISKITAHIRAKKTP